MEDDVEKLREFRVSLRQFADRLIVLMRETDRLESLLLRRGERRVVQTSAMKLRTTEIVPAKLAYTLREAAAATGLGRSTLYAARSAGKLTFWRCGGRTLIKSEELRRWLDEMPTTQ